MQNTFLVQSLQGLHLKKQKWTLGISSSSLPSTCWEICTFRPCALPEPGHRSIAPCQRWMIPFPHPCKGSRIFFITFPQSIYTIIAARICVIWKSPLIKKSWKEDQWLSIYYLKRKKYLTPDVCQISHFVSTYVSHFVHLKLESVYTFNTGSGNINAFRAQSYLDFILSAHCPFPQSRFCIILLRSERLKCSNPSPTFR